jgi:hypothetical protein
MAGWHRGKNGHTARASYRPQQNGFSDFLVHGADRWNQPNAGKNGIQVKAIQPRWSDSSVNFRPTYQNSHVKSTPTV